MIKKIARISAEWGAVEQKKDSLDGDYTFPAQPFTKLNLATSAGESEVFINKNSTHHDDIVDLLLKQYQTHAEALYTTSCESLVEISTKNVTTPMTYPISKFVEAAEELREKYENAEVTSSDTSITVSRTVVSEEGAKYKYGIELTPPDTEYDEELVGLYVEDLFESLYGEDVEYEDEEGEEEDDEIDEDEDE